MAADRHAGCRTKLMRGFKILSILPHIVIVLFALLTLSMCGSSSSSTTLPLAEDRPTFIYFFSDN
jgi:hypothetical protein